VIVASFHPSSFADKQKQLWSFQYSQAAILRSEKFPQGLE
jgi:hypothetical protein